MRYENVIETIKKFRENEKMRRLSFDNELDQLEAMVDEAAADSEI